MKKFEDKTAIIKIIDGEITLIRKKNRLLMLIPYGFVLMLILIVLHLFISMHMPFWIGWWQSKDKNNLQQGCLYYQHNSRWGKVYKLVYKDKSGNQHSIVNNSRSLFPLSFPSGKKYYSLEREYLNHHNDYCNKVIFVYAYTKPNIFGFYVDSYFVYDFIN
jgi:hypothetical protein